MLRWVSQPLWCGCRKPALSHCKILRSVVIFLIEFQQTTRMLEDRKTMLSAEPEGRNNFAAEPERFTLPWCTCGKLGRCCLPDSRLRVFSEHSFPRGRQPNSCHPCQTGGQSKGRICAAQEGTLLPLCSFSWTAECKFITR